MTVCVQNQWITGVNGDDDRLIDDLRAPYRLCAVLSVSAYSGPLQSSVLTDVASLTGATAMEVSALTAVSSRAQYPSHSRHLVDGAFEGKSDGDRNRLVRRCHQATDLWRRDQSCLMASDSRRRSTSFATPSLAALRRGVSVTSDVTAWPLLMSPRRAAGGSPDRVPRMKPQRDRRRLLAAAHHGPPEYGLPRSARSPWRPRRVPR